MTLDQLSACTKKELAEKARRLGIANFSSLVKDDLVKAIARAMKKRQLEREKAKAASTTTPAKASATKASAEKNGKHSMNGKVATKAAKESVAEVVKPRPQTQKGTARDTTAEGPSAQEQINRSKFEMGIPTRDLSAKLPKALPNGYGKDNITVMPVDPFWLHAYWELTQQSVQRAEAALGQDWHGSKPILRICDVSSQDTTSTAEAILRDIEIHGGCNNWYIEVTHPPRSYRVDIGYISKRGQFFVLARSNVSTTPKMGVSDTLDETWSETTDPKQADRIFAMSGGHDPRGGGSFEMKQLFEERHRRSMSSPSGTNFASVVIPATPKERKFFFELDAALVIFGRTEPGAKVTLQGEVIKLSPDGTFTVRHNFPAGRLIIPAVAASADGVEERTIVLAVERNTKELEPMIHDGNEAE